MHALFRYRSRGTFLEIVTNPALSGKHDFKAAALDKNITFPIEPKLYLGDLRLVLGLILLALAALIDSALMSRKLNTCKQRRRNKSLSSPIYGMTRGGDPYSDPCSYGKKRFEVGK
jgi:hypothetical protein